MSGTTGGLKVLTREWVKGVMKKQDIIEYEIEITGCTGKGEGYIGDITFVKITDTAGNIKLFDYVVKSGKDNEMLRSQVPIDDAYISEKYFYTEVYPAFAKFQSNHRIEKPFKHVPAFVGHEFHKGISILIFENLKPEGFEMYNKDTPMNLEHLKMLLDRYGKFHAVSLAMRHINPEQFSSLCSKLKNVFRGFMDEGGIVEPMTEVVKSVYGLFEKEPEVLNKYKKVAQGARDIFLHLIDKTDPYNIISHLDCWNNNYMFKYQVIYLM